MAQETTLQRRLSEKRALALATVLLTRPRDLEVRVEPADLGVDLLVSFNRENKAGLRQFGVELKAVLRTVPPTHANSVLKSSMRQTLRSGPFPFPVVLLFFTMKADEGWYTWIAEPVVSPDGDFALRQHEGADCRPLDERAVDEIVERVDRWYDAFYARTNGTMPTGGRTNGARP